VSRRLAPHVKIKNWQASRTFDLKPKPRDLKVRGKKGAAYRPFRNFVPQGTCFRSTLSADVQVLPHHKMRSNDGKTMQLDRASDSIAHPTRLK
jgi:hypothetical protein